MSIFTFLKRITGNTASAVTTVSGNIASDVVGGVASGVGVVATDAATILRETLKANKQLITATANISVTAELPALTELATAALKAQGYGIPAVIVEALVKTTADAMLSKLDKSI